MSFLCALVVVQSAHTAYSKTAHLYNSNLDRRLMSRDAKEGCGTHYALQAIGFLFLLFASLNTTMLIIGAQLPALDGESKERPWLEFPPLPLTVYLSD